MGALTATLICPAATFAAQPASTHTASRRTARLKPLTRQQRIQQALNRFTFGPRPGDEAAVERMGLDRWFEEQLHPGTIPDTDLNARLARFPAMQLSQAELIAEFPPPGVLRRISRGAMTPAANTPVEQAIYADASLRYEQKLAAKTTSAAAPAGGTMNPGPASMSMAGQTAALAQKAQSSEAKAPPMEEAQLDTILAMPPAERMQRLVALTPEEMDGLGETLRPIDRPRLVAGLSPAQVEQVAAMQNPERVVGEEAMASRLLRDVYSQRQLQAVMTDFWLNHFNVYLRKNQNEPYLLPAYEREAILPHALGRFEDLLVATAESPAMQVYLDNWESIGPNSKAAMRGNRPAQSRPAKPKAAQGINENYARELMELHTLGVNGGYTQQDVIEVAKCFTGWTVQPPAQGGGFVFNPNRHEPGPKTVLGTTIPEGGQQEGLTVLHMLASSPATAHFLSQELAERFVSDDPPPALVNRMAQSYLKHDGDISEVLRTMFHSPEFWSPAVYRAKVKTPLEFAVSALRASDAEVNNPAPLVQAMARLGMPVYGMQTPNGYSWQGEDWVSSGALLTRMNFALTLSSNRLPGTRVVWPAELGTGVDASEAPDAATEARLEQLIFGAGYAVAPQTRAAVLTQAAVPGTQQAAAQSFKAVGQKTASPGAADANWVPAVAARPKPSGAPEQPLDTMAGLLLGSPDFQRR